MPELRFTGWGYGVEPCPGCGELPQPGEERVTEPGKWFVWHATCFDEAMSLL